MPALVTHTPSFHDSPVPHVQAPPPVTPGPLLPLPFSSHFHPCSSVHEPLQPSPFCVFPSSHSSAPSFLPLPHTVDAAEPEREEPERADDRADDAPCDDEPP